MTWTPPATRSGSRPPAMTSAGAWWWRASARSSTISRSAATRTTCPICRSARKRTASRSSTRPRVSRAMASGFRIPAGLLIEIKVAAKVSPAHKTPGTWSSSPEGVAGAPVRAKAAHRASAPAVTRARVHPRRGSLAGVLLEHRRPAALRPFRPRRLHARHPRQRPSHPGVRAIVRTRIAPLQLGHERHRRHRAGRHAHGGQGLQRGLGSGRHVLGSNYFHYVRDPLGQLCGVLLRHRLHPGRSKTGRPAAIRPNTSSTCGAPSRRPTSRSTASYNRVPWTETSRGFGP